MLKQCSSKLAFSRSKWYISALNTITKRSWAFNQQRASATLLEYTPSFDTATPRPILPRLEPLRTTTPKTEITTPESNAQDFKIVEVLQRCSGFKKIDGKQCRRTVFVDPENVGKPAYCHQHNPNKTKKKTDMIRLDTKEMPKMEAFKITKGTNLPNLNHKLHDCWDLWIHPRIKKEYKSLIRQELVKPVSEGDRPGYIYAYFLESGPLVSKQNFAYFKIGRTSDPHRRMYQVSHSCNVVPKIIELFPSFPTNHSRMSTNLETIDDTSMAELPKCPISHRVERLILLELTGLYQKGGFKCKCRTRHREWFKINRIRNEDRTLMTDKQLFDVFIRPTILRWIQYGVVASAIL